MSAVPHPLTRNEWIPCFADKLEFEAKERLQTAMAVVGYTWDAVTEQQIKDLLISEFAVQESNVSEVLIQFGPNRYKKPSDMSVATYYHKFKAQLPMCMKPVGDVQCREFVDLIQRSLFYLNLEDSYIQEKLCELKEADQKLSLFLEEAVKAESHRKAFKDIGSTGATLDSTQEVGIAQWDAKNKSDKKPFQKSGKFQKNWSDRSSESRGGGGTSKPGPPQRLLLLLRSLRLRQKSPSSQKRRRKVIVSLVVSEGTIQ